jgi:hypothetical protein
MVPETGEFDCRNSVQIGKELLQPELPLKVRLVGLRVTKLKDLRRAESPSGGIRKAIDPRPRGLRDQLTVCGRPTVLRANLLG